MYLKLACLPTTDPEQDIPGTWYNISTESSLATRDRQIVCSYSTLLDRGKLWNVWGICNDIRLDENPTKLPQTRRDIPRSVVRVRRSYSASTNVITTQSGSAYIYYFFLVLVDFFGQQWKPKHEKKRRKKCFCCKKKKIDNEHVVGLPSSCLCFFVFLTVFRKISRLFLAFVFQSEKLFHDTILVVQLTFFDILCNTRYWVLIIIS